MTSSNIQKPIALLCYLLSVFMALSIDIYLPSLPSITKSFGTTIDQAKLSLNIFLLGFGLSQIFYGIISDHFGRKKTLILGLMIYFVSSIGCMFSTSIDALIFFRFLQSLGACSASVSAYALARDFYDGKELTKVIANIAIIMTIVPSLAPLAGGMIDKTIGWRFSFFILSCLSLFTLFFSYHFLRKKDTYRAFTIDSLIKNYVYLMFDKPYLIYTIIGANIFVALYFFIAASPFLLIQHINLNPIQYGIVMALNAIFLTLGNQLAKKINEQHSPSFCAKTGALIMLISSILMIILSKYPMFFILFIFMCSTGIGIISPASMAAALENQKHNSGQASSLSGFIRFSLAMFVSTLFIPSFMTTGLVIGFCAILNLILLFVSLPLRKVHNI